MARKHEALIRQFPEYEHEIVKLGRGRDFDEKASRYERLRQEIHALEASGDVGPDYTALCDERDSLQEHLVIRLQEAAGPAHRP